MVFRHRGMVVAFVAVSGFVLLLALLIGTEATSGNVVGIAVMSAGLWFFWVVGWGSKVVISREGVMIDNAFTRHVVPWPVFGGFEVDGGLVTVLGDGTRLRVLSFGGSLAGAVTGYRAMGRTCQAMVAACGRLREAAPPGPSRYHRRIITSWPVLVIYLVLLEALAVGVDLSHHVL